MGTLEDALLVDVAPDGWDHPAGEPPDTRLRMDVAAASLEVDADGCCTGWAWLRGRRVLPGGSTRSGKALVRISALPGDLRIRHQGAGWRSVSYSRPTAWAGDKVHKQTKGTGHSGHRQRNRSAVGHR